MTSSYGRYVIVTCLVLFQVLGSTAYNLPLAVCCSTNLMDVTGLVAIEAGRQLVTTTDTFPAIRVYGCTNDSVSVQIWRKTGDNTYQFRWSTELTKAYTNLVFNFITVTLDNAPLQITPDDRIGVFTILDSERLTVPFTLDSTAGLYYSTDRFTDYSQMTASAQVTLDSTKWPRSFSQSIVLCKQSMCADLPPVATPPPTTTVSTTRGTTISGNCCPTYPVSCDPSDVTNSLNNQTSRVIELQNTIQQITKLINDLFGSRQQTGTCPTGFTPGTLGVGKCYLLFRDPVQMAVAVLNCRDNLQARLVAIESLAEEQFLVTMVANNSAGGMQNFWTSGMYNKGAKGWFWYDSSSNSRTNQVYQNWEDTNAPVPTSDADVCSTLAVDLTAKTDFWRKQYCTSLNFYICETQKTCL